MAGTAQAMVSSAATVSAVSSGIDPRWRRLERWNVSGRSACATSAADWKRFDGSTCRPFWITLSQRFGAGRLTEDTGSGPLPLKTATHSAVAGVHVRFPGRYLYTTNVDC